MPGGGRMVEVDIDGDGAGGIVAAMIGVGDGIAVVVGAFEVADAETGT